MLLSDLRYYGRPELTVVGGMYGGPGTLLRLSEQKPEGLLALGLSRSG